MWPYEFGGLNYQPQHDREAMFEHAVFDYEAMSSYLKPSPFFLTILREPASQAISSYNFWLDREFSWDWEEQLLQMRRAIDGQAAFRTSDHDELHFLAQYVNAMSFDLGWYYLSGFGDRSTSHDHDATRIANFVQYLDSKLSMVLITEELDKSLVLLARATGLSIPEITSLPFKRGFHQGAATADNSRGEKSKVYPTDEQRAELQGMLQVDQAIYDHFRSKFEHQWQEAVVADPSVTEELARLQCLNQRLLTDCAGGRGPRCHQAYLVESRDYAYKLASGGFRDEKFGVPNGHRDDDDDG